MEDLARAPVMGADPLAGEHLARGDDDRLLVVGIEARLRRIADQHDRAGLELGIGGPSTVSTSDIVTLGRSRASA